MTDSVLDNLVKAGSIKSYEYQIIDADGNVLEQTEGMMCAEKLVITFHDNNKLLINTFCSGTHGNTSLVLSSIRREKIIDRGNDNITRL